MREIKKRVDLDCHFTMNLEPLRQVFLDTDFSGMALLEFGFGGGAILRLLKDTAAEVIYAFDVCPCVDEEIQAWANDHFAKPRLIINPPEFKSNSECLDGDISGYDYLALLQKHQRFGIVSNPPYFLYNRILSLTGSNLAKGAERFSVLKEKFQGAIMITSQERLMNHPGWQIKTMMLPSDFSPRASCRQYLVQIGFVPAFDLSTNSFTPVQKYVDINNRDPNADPTDSYPHMWSQLYYMRNKALNIVNTQMSYDEFRSLSQHVNLEYTGPSICRNIPNSFHTGVDKYLIPGTKGRILSANEKQISGHFGQIVFFEAFENHLYWGSFTYNELLGNIKIL